MPASAVEPLDGLLNAHRKQWTQGLHIEMRRHVMVANLATFVACLELALNAEEAEGVTETVVIHAINDTMPPIFQEREAVENLTKGLAELQLLAEAKEHKNLPSGESDSSGEHQPHQEDEVAHGMAPQGEISGSTDGGATR